MSKSFYFFLQDNYGGKYQGPSRWQFGLYIDVESVMDPQLPPATPTIYGGVFHPMGSVTLLKNNQGVYDSTKRS